MEHRFTETIPYGVFDRNGFVFSRETVINAVDKFKTGNQRRHKNTETMKANELAIDDIIQYRGNAYKIYAIYRSNVFVCLYPYAPKNSDGSALGHSVVLLQEINPTPLTPEILEKNGWRCHHIDSFGYPSDADWYFYNSGISARYAKISGKENMMFLDCHIQYVHELQHALRLCGLAELANNFKV